MPPECRGTPCEACPYRRDVPSGVWDAEEYDQLRAYDGETWQQSPRLFMCHATPARVCHGWAAVSGDESLALRIAGVHPPEPKVPVFATHAEAADHGMVDVEDPPPEAVAIIARLTAKHERLRDA